jgi:hypothetical protein
MTCRWLRDDAARRYERRELRRLEREDEVEIVTWSGHVLRPRRRERLDEYGTTARERRQATRNVVDWVRSQVDVP